MNPSQEPTPQPYESVEGADYPPAYSYGPAAGWEPEKPRHRPWRRNLIVGALATLIIAVAGVALGVVWHFISPTVPVLDAGQNGIVVNDPSPEEYVAADGWFTIIGFAFGLVAAIVAWMVVRRDRGPGLLLGVTIGALAAAPVAWQVGRRIGLGAYERWRDTATAGVTYHAPPDLHTHGALLVPAFAAVIVTTLLAGWSNDPDLEQPGAKPGYGHEVPTGADQPTGQDLTADAGLPPEGGFQPGSGLSGGEVPPQGHVPTGFPPVAGPPADLPGRRDQG